MENFISMSQKGQNNWKELTVWVKCVKSEKKKKASLKSVMCSHKWVEK